MHYYINILMRLSKPLTSIMAMCTLLALAHTSIAQTIHTLSINPKIPAQYDDLQTVINLANANDIIYVHPAAENYDGNDSLVIDKPLTIIGGGFYNDNLTYAGDITKFNKIRIKPGNGKIKIANLSANRIIVEGDTENTFEDLRIEYVFTDRLDFEANNNKFLSNSLRVINSIIPLISFESWNEIDEFAKINIENNIIGQIANGGGTNLLIRNNIFNPTIFGKIALANLYNATIVNNIFYGDDEENAIGASTTNFCIYDRNLSYQTSDVFRIGIDNVIGNNNFNNRNPSFTSLFRNWDTVAEIVRSNFSLLTGSPAIGSGTEGTDIGIGGGEFPFTPSSRYGLPHVKSIRVNNPVLGESDTLRFTIEGIYPTQN